MWPAWCWAGGGGGITVSRSVEARVGAGALAVAQAVPVCACGGGSPTRRVARGNEEAGVATLLEQVRSNAGGKGCGRLGHIRG